MACADASGLTPPARMDRAQQAGQPSQAARSGSGWRGFAARRAAKARSSPSILTDFPEKFAERRQLWLLPRRRVARPAALPRRARSSSPTTGCTRAASCCTSPAWIRSPQPKPSPGSSSPFPAPSEPPLAEDEAYIGDLIGCATARVDVAEAEHRAVRRRN